MAPRPSQEPPRPSQDGPETPQEPPRSPQEGPKTPQQAPRPPKRPPNWAYMHVCIYAVMQKCMHTYMKCTTSLGHGESSMHRGGAPVTRPVGVLDPAPPKGCSCVGSDTKSFRFPKPQDRRGSSHRMLTFCLLGPTWLYLGPTWPSCPPCSSILSNLAPTWLQLGPSLPQLGST